MSPGDEADLPPGAREAWQPGDRAWYEYRCLESDDSADAELWHRSHQQVTVLGRAADEDFSGTFLDRAEVACPNVYRIRFPDGYEGDAVEDELLTSPEHYDRPDPPARPSDPEALVAGPAYLPPVVSHAGCCRGDDLRHEAVSDAPVPFADGHACVDCCPCLDCGAYRAAQRELDPSAWPPGAQPDMREGARPGESETAAAARPRPSSRAAQADFPAPGQVAAPGQANGVRRRAASRSRPTAPGRAVR